MSNKVQALIFDCKNDCSKILITYQKGKNNGNF